MDANSSKQKSVLIIGAGIAGLSTGIYAQLNGYKSQIYEMHSLPGGLMTAWKRKGYTIDGCIHWLTGSAKQSSYHKLWEEIGLIQGREIYNPEIFIHFENTAGQVVNFYTNIDRLEQHLLEIGPEDRALIRSYCSAVRAARALNPPVDTSTSRLGKTFNGLKTWARFISFVPRMIYWSRMTSLELSQKFKNPLLREAFASVLLPDLSAVAIIMTLAYLNDDCAGYPIGGSLPMAHAVAKRYCDLGGEIHYNQRVVKILVEPNPDGKTSRAVGLRLGDGSEVRADHVISAADGHATHWDLLGGEFLTDKVRQIYADFKLFPAILLVGLGVNRTFPELPGATGGYELKLSQPIEAGAVKTDKLGLMVYNFDPTLAPAGKTVVTAMFDADYNYWTQLAAEDRERYDAEKQRVAMEVIQRLSARFPGLEGQVEMADVATPLTFERYTGNWQASFEGFLPAPGVLTTAIPKTLPNLTNFAMAGQWVQVGGGLPSGVSTGREVISLLCKQDGKKFMN